MTALIKLLEKIIFFIHKNKNTFVTINVYEIKHNFVIRDKCTGWTGEMSKKDY